MKTEKKKVALILLLGVAVFGTLLWWVLSPILANLGLSKAQEDGVNINPYADELAMANDATAREEGYLDDVNEPIDTITDADDGSLALIKKGDFGWGKKEKDETKDDDYKVGRGEKREKVSTLDNAKRRVSGGKLGRLSLASALGGAGGGRGGFSGGDLDRFKGRFGKDSNFKGANVATGPSAKTKIGGKGTRKNADPKADLSKAAAAQKAFGEGSAKSVDPKSAREGLKDLAGAVPKDLSDNKKGNDKPDTPDSNEPVERERDPCAQVEPLDSGAAWTQMLTQVAMGAAFVTVAYFMAPSGGSGGEGGGGNSVLGNISGSLATSGIGMATQGITGGVRDLTDPNRPIRECRQGRSSSTTTGAATPNSSGSSGS
ncbi:MAG: hypothetical protein HYT79_11710 [Elusimicrobia bacterium]|nr:hypothetical protein [Elusimicrobiota bacterium]